MASSSKVNHVRSISLPCRSHPTTFQIEEELSELIRTWESSAATSAESISSGLCGLVELYNSMDELLSLPQTLQSLSKHHNQKWVDGLLEGPVKLLDICGVTRDVISQAKGHVRDLQSSLRRRKGDLSDIEASITNYTSFRKKMKKDAKRLITSLKQMDQKIEASSSIIDVDQQVSAVIRVLREVNVMSISIFQSVLVFLSAAKSKPSRSIWSILRLMHKGAIVACHGQTQNTNEFESIDDALCRLSTNGSSEAENIQFVHNRLETLESSFESIETGLESMFRCLIKSRTSLLNLVSC